MITKKLGFIIHETSERNRSHEDIPVYSVTNNYGFMPSTDYFSKEVFSKELGNYKIVHKGMFAYNPSRINVGSIDYLQSAERVIISPLYVVFSIADGTILPELLKHYLKSETGRLAIKLRTSGSVRDNLSFAALSKIEIPIYSLATQQEITQKLSSVCTIIKKKEEQLNELDNLVKSQFIEMFGYNGKKVALVDYVWFQEGPGVRSADFTQGGTRLLTGSNINNNCISFGYKSDRYISRELANGKYNHFLCNKDDILVVSSAIDPSRFDEKVTTVNEDMQYCLNTGIIRFKPNKKYLTLGYFREFLKTDYFKYQVMEEMRGIAQMHFGPSHLKKMTILLPDSIDRQNEFECFVEQVDKSKIVGQMATCFDGKKEVAA